MPIVVSVGDGGRQFPDPVIRHIEVTSLYFDDAVLGRLLRKDIRERDAEIKEALETLPADQEAPRKRLNRSEMEYRRVMRNLNRERKKMGLAPIQY